MTPLTDIARTGRKAANQRPWPRSVVGIDGWKRAIQELVEARATLLGLWGDKDAVHLALLEERSDAIAVFTLPGAFNDGRVDASDLLVIDARPFVFTP